MSGMVLDSSVVGCWCFPDDASPVADEAFGRLGSAPGIVPQLWWFEVRNLLVVNERRGRIDAAGSAAFLADLERLPIRFDREPDSGSTLALARAHRLTVHDAAYLELARRFEAPLATLDRRRAAAAGAAGVARVGE